MLWWPHVNKETAESSFFFSFSKNWLFYCSSVLFCCPCKALSKVDFEKCSINKDYDYYTINVCLSHYILLKACIRHTLTAWIQSLSLMHLSVQQVEQPESTSCQLIRSPSADYWALMVLSETTGVSAKKKKDRRILLAGGVKCHSPLLGPDDAELHTNLAARDKIAAAYHKQAQASGFSHFVLLYWVRISTLQISFFMVVCWAFIQFLNNRIGWLATNLNPSPTGSQFHVQRLMLHITAATSQLPLTQLTL